MSRWGLAKIVDRYIIQVSIVIFQDLFSNVSFLSPEYPSRNFVWRNLLPKTNIGTQASLVYPRDTRSYGCQFQRGCVE